MVKSEEREGEIGNKKKKKKKKKEEEKETTTIHQTKPKQQHTRIITHNYDPLRRKSPFWPLQEKRILTTCRIVSLLPFVGSIGYA